MDHARPITVRELTIRYARALRERGYSDSEIRIQRAALRYMLRKKIRRRPAVRFGPKSFSHVRSRMIRDGLSRRTISVYMSRIRRMFAWGVSQEIIPPSVVTALQCLPALRPGEDGVKPDPPSILAVPIEHVEAALVHMKSPWSDMVVVQAATGMRVSEMLQLRARNIDMTMEPWLFRPPKHKRAHKGEPRVIGLPQHLAPIFERIGKDCRGRWRDERFWFSRSANRYRAAIVEACRKAGVPEWSPHQLRHRFATDLLDRLGAEKTQAMLGHSSLRSMERYTKDRSGTVRAATKEIGIMGDKGDAQDLSAANRTTLPSSVGAPERRADHRTL